MTRYSIEPRTRKYFRWYEFLLNLSKKNGKKLLTTATKTWLDVAITVSKNVFIKELKQ